MSDLGRVGIIANPVAQSGACAAVAESFADMLCQQVGQDACRLLLTEHPGHAIDMARAIHDVYDTLIAIGGDGLVHEAANGLMRIPPEYRPDLAVVPVGSGNDYALTLGMSKDPQRALEQILAHDARRMDVGCVNGEYFVETLSFGIDAAIALDTVERRKKSGRHGTILYMESGIDQILNHRVANAYHAELSRADGEAPSLALAGESYVFAVQIGKTYGGHFKICPDADPQDGLFDVCIAHAPLSAARALLVFLLAKGGHHTGFDCMESHQCPSLVVEFDEAPACQADGEKVTGTHFEVTMLPRELSVLVGDYEA